MSWLRRTAPSNPPRPARPSQVGQAAPPVVGQDPSGSPRQLDFATGSTTAVLFLTSSCQACQGFWGRLSVDASLPGGAAVAVATPGSALESRRKVADLAPVGLDVVMSGRAWDDYGVTGSPFAVVIADGAVAAEGPVLAWTDLVRLVAP